MPVPNTGGELVLTPIDNETSFSYTPHEVTLQRLDTLLRFPGIPSGKLKYAVDNFAGTEGAWDKTLAVFVPEGVPIQHVDHVAFADDPYREAQRLGFRIAGHHANTRVIANGPGEPRVTTQAVFTDPDAEAAAKEGRLSLSSGFDAEIIRSEGAIKGTVVPNHVLYFIRNNPVAGSGAPAAPNDAAAMINNLSEDTMPEDPEVKGMFKSILDHVTPKENPLQKTVDNLDGELKGKEAKIAELEAQIEALTKERDALKADKQTLDNLMATQAKTKKDTQWSAIKNLYKPGMFHKPEDEQARRAEFEADPVAFQLANINNLQTEKPKPAEGTEAVGNLGDPDAPVDVAKERGMYNYQTHQFEVK